MSKVILYDIPSRDNPPIPWSLNTWKTRLALNFKGIDYETKWVEYPDIPEAMKGFNVQPAVDGFKPYTCPALRFPDGQVIMDSKAIIEPLEKLYPEPSLHLDETELLEQAEKFVSPCFAAVNGSWIAKVPRDILPRRSAEYFHKDRTERVKKDLDQYEAENSGDDVWEKAKSSYERLGALLREKGGPYFLGETPSYADFYIVSFLQMFKVVDPALFERAIAFDPAIGKLYDACKKWTERVT